MQRSSLLFVPSVGPGYIDTRVRPWNEQTTRNRRNGEYYNSAWRTAISVLPNMVSITSFNEWHEGTQIEAAIPKTIKDFSYLSYDPNPPDMYLTLTGNWVDEFVKSKNLTTL